MTNIDALALYLIMSAAGLIAGLVWWLLTIWLDYIK